MLNFNVGKTVAHKLHKTHGCNKKINYNTTCTYDEYTYDEYIYNEYIYDEYISKDICNITVTWRFKMLNNVTKYTALNPQMQWENH